MLAMGKSRRLVGRTKNAWARLSIHEKIGAKLAIFQIEK